MSTVTDPDRTAIKLSALRLARSTTPAVREIMIAAAATLGFFALARIGSLAGVTGKTPTPFWAASGLGLALALTGHRACLLGLGLGSFLGALWSLNWPAAFTVAVSDLVSAWVAARLYRKMEESLVWLGPLRTGLSLFVAGAIVAGISALCSPTILGWLFALPAQTVEDMRVTWFLGDALGVLIAGPVFILLLDWLRRPTWPDRTTVIWVLTSIVLSAVALGVAISMPDRKGWIFALLLTALTVSGSKTNPAATKVVLFVSVLLLLVAVNRFGLRLSNSTPDEERLVLSSFIAGLGIVLLVMADNRQAGDSLGWLPRGIYILGCFTAARIFGQIEIASSERQAAKAEQLGDIADTAMKAHVDNFLTFFRPATYLLSHDPHLSPADWAQYLKTLEPAENFPGIKAMGFVAAMPPGSHTASSGVAEPPTPPPGAPDRPEVSALTERMVLTLWGPGAGPFSVGDDLASIPPVLAAARRGRDLGRAQLILVDAQAKAAGAPPSTAPQPGASAPPALRQRGTEKQLWILWPVYDSPAPPGGVAERRQHLRGWLLATFNLQGLEKRVLSRLPGAVDLTIYTGASPDPKSQIYSSQPAKVGPGTLSRTRTSTVKVLNAHFTLAWTIEIDDEPSSHVRTMLGSLALTLISAFLSSLVLNLRAFSHRVERQVQQRTLELQRSNLRLAQQEAENHHLALIATEASNAVMLMDADARITWVNESFTQLYGYTLEEAKGRLPWEVLNGPETDPATVARKQAELQNHHSFSLEVLHYTKLGRKVWVHTAWRTIINAEGKVTGHLAIQTDFTLHKEFERKLQAATAAAEEANAAKSSLVANVSHELRTPLNVIMGNVQLWRSGAFGTVTEGQAPSLRNIEESSQHLLLLINDLLDVSRAEAGKLEMKLDAIDVTRLAETATAMTASSAKLKLLQITTDFRHRTNGIEGDELRLKQILLNLLGNAVKFTSSGGTVTFSIEETGQPAELLFRISDNGPGIPLADQERIFEKFEQGDHLSHSGGTGLGLPIARRLARLHGGDVSVASEPGHGSTFTLRLPIRLPAHAPAAVARPEPATNPASTQPAALPPPAAASGALILAVDDFDLNLDILAMYLKGEGYRVIQATSGPAALNEARAQRPDLILMDVKMAGMDGLEAIRRLKQDATTRDIPVISLTAFATDADAKRCLTAGAADYAAKPIDFPELGRKISAQLAKRA